MDSLFIKVLNLSIKIKKYGLEKYGQYDVNIRVSNNDYSTLLLMSGNTIINNEKIIEPFPGGILFNGVNVFQLLNFNDEPHVRIEFREI